MLRGLKNILIKINKVLGPDWVTPVFLLIFLVAWAMNAFKKATFDLAQLQGMYIAVRSTLLAQHGIDSGLNSKIGEMPKRGEA